MFITDVSIRRPVVAWVMSLILIVFGIFVFSQLPVRELPEGLQPPVVQIKVDYKSASAPNWSRGNSSNWKSDWWNRRSKKY